MESTRNTILIVAILLLAVGEVGLFYQNYKLTSAPSSVVYGDPQDQDVLSQISVGGAVMSVLGNVEAIDSSSITLRVPDGIVMKININVNTKVFSTNGDQKDPQLMAIENEAYEKRVKELVKDPEANREELGRIIVPFSLQEVPASLDNLKVGDMVGVFAFEGAEGAYDAVKVVLFTN
jgi:hypothetical protein